MASKEESLYLLRAEVFKKMNKNSEALEDYSKAIKLTQLILRHILREVGFFRHKRNLKKLFWILIKLLNWIWIYPELIMTEEMHIIPMRTINKLKLII